LQWPVAGETQERAAADSARGGALESVKQNCYRHRGWRRACVVRPPTSVILVIIKSARAAGGQGEGLGRGRTWRLRRACAGMRSHSSRGLQQQSALKTAEDQWQPLHAAARASCDCDCGGRRQRGAWRHAARELGIRASPLLRASHVRHCNGMGWLGFLLFASCNTHTAPLSPPAATTRHLPRPAAGQRQQAAHAPSPCPPHTHRHTAGNVF
jgi:hypothetical protein